MPALIAVCPKCNNDAPVPEDAVGKKVKCKKCQNIFVIEPLPSGKIEKPGAKSRPKTKSPARPATKSGAKASESGAHRRPQKKSNAMLWVIMGVAAIAAAGAGGAAYYLNNQPPEEKHPKSSGKERAESKQKGPAAKNESKTKGNDSSKVAKADPTTPRTPRVDAKNPPEFKDTNVPVAPLSKGIAISEISDLGAVKQVFLFHGKTTRVGLYTKDKGKSHFETYDLDQGLRIGKFPIPDDTQYLDCDPTGECLALYNKEHFLYAYELPIGAPLQDDWRPYHEIKDQERFIGDTGEYGLFTVLSKDALIVLTNRNAGDIWDLRKAERKFLIPSFSHEKFKGSSNAKGHDTALSADRKVLAFTSDDGIEFLDTSNGNKIGKADLSKFGGKAAVLGMGFDPEKKSLAAYIGSGKDAVLARFAVPSGEPIGTPEKGLDPGDFANISFVSGNVFMSCEHPDGRTKDTNRVGGLFDLSGKQLVECVFSPRRIGMFSTSVVNKQVAFAYVNKEKPSIGVVDLPMPGSAPAAVTPEMPTGDKDKTETPPTPPPVASKGGLLDILGKTPATPPPTPKTPQTKEAPATPTPPVAAVRQERWEFGGQGILKKGESR